MKGPRRKIHRNLRIKQTIFDFMLTHILNHKAQKGINSQSPRDWEEPSPSAGPT